MDERLRENERRAKAGDLDAAMGWLKEASRIVDYNAQYEALMLICELQHPGLMEQMKEMQKTLDILKDIEPRPAPIVEEIWITHTTGT